jgi:hypothetical protein
MKQCVGPSISAWITAHGSARFLGWLGCGQRSVLEAVSDRFLQEVLEEWLVLKIRGGDTIPNLGRVKLSVQAA